VKNKLNGIAVRLYGRYSDLQYLSERFSSPDFAIAKYGETYYMTIEEITPKTETHDLDIPSNNEALELINHATRLVSFINGEAQLERALFGSVDEGMQYEDPVILPIQVTSDVTKFVDGRPISGVSRINVELSASQSYRLFGTIPATVPSKAVIIKQRKLIETHFPLKLANHDEKVEEALTCFGYPHDWNNLYKVWDVISPDFGKLQNDDLINTVNDDRFKKTANHHRHGGDQKAHLPQIPMSLGEASRYIKVLMILWLALRQNQ